MNVTICSADLVVDDKESVALLQAVLARILSHRNVKAATVYCSGREKSGWCEHIMRLEYEDGGGMTIGAIQRQPGNTFEFHS